MPIPNLQRRTTLWLVTVLHAFTHVFQLMLVPLYLPIVRDLHLTGDSQATLLVTVQGLTYFGSSLMLGILADRFSRKSLLSIGLMMNALAYLGLAHAPSYGWAIVWMAASGFFGSFYHPAATALLMSLYPEKPGRALGISGMGAAAGLSLGPLYAGWRAADWGWRQPCFEVAVGAAIAALLFQWLAAEPPQALRRSSQTKQHTPRRSMITLLVVAVVAAVFSLRDFGTSGMTTLTSLFLQHVLDFSPKTTGLYIGLMFLVGIFSNPLIGWLSDKNRFASIAGVLVIAAFWAAAVPWMPGSLSIGTVMCLYGFFALASYPIVEAALLESVPDSLRGRTYGMFITISGIVGSLAHWAMGQVADFLGQRGHDSSSYHSWFLMLGLTIVLSLAGIPAIQWLRRHRTGQEKRETTAVKT